ncbi:hypothetical protein [Streptosporangium sp. NPDC000509]
MGDTGDPMAGRTAGGHLLRLATQAGLIKTAMTFSGRAAVRPEF